MISDQLYRAYRLLGLSPKATIGEVKKAYRNLAKTTHPDVNPSPEASEQFIAINEAMDYIIAVRTGKIYDKQKGTYDKPSPEQERRKKERQNQKAEYYAHWVKEQARKRAEEAKNWKEYVKSDHYHSVQRLNSGELTLILGMYAFIGFVLVASFLETPDPELVAKGYKWERIIIPVTFCTIFSIPLTYFFCQNLKSEVTWYKHCWSSWKTSRKNKFSFIDFLNLGIVLFALIEFVVAFFAIRNYILFI